MELSEVSSVHSSKTRKSAKFPSTLSIAATSVTSEEIAFTKSEAHSYRQKLRERFNSVKNRVGKHASIAGDFRGVSNKISVLQNSIRLLQGENDITESEIRNRGGGDNFEEYMFFCQDNIQDEGQKATEVINR